MGSFISLASLCLFLFSASGQDLMSQRSAAVFLTHFCRSKALRYLSVRFKPTTLCDREHVGAEPPNGQGFIHFFTKTLSVLLKSHLPLQLSLYGQAIVIFTGTNKFHTSVLRAKLKTLLGFFPKCFSHPE